MTILCRFDKMAGRNLITLGITLNVNRLNSQLTGRQTGLKDKTRFSNMIKKDTLKQEDTER